MRNQLPLKAPSTSLHLEQLESRLAPAVLQLVERSDIGNVIVQTIYSDGQEVKVDKQQLTTLPASATTRNTSGSLTLRDVSLTSVEMEATATATSDPMVSSAFADVRGVVTRTYRIAPETGENIGDPIQVFINFAAEAQPGGLDGPGAVASAYVSNAPGNAAGGEVKLAESASGKRELFGRRIGETITLTLRAEAHTRLNLVDQITSSGTRVYAEVSVAAIQADPKLVSFGGPLTSDDGNKFVGNVVIEYEGDDRAPNGEDIVVQFFKSADGKSSVGSAIHTVAISPNAIQASAGKLKLLTPDGEADSPAFAFQSGVHRLLIRAAETPLADALNDPETEYILARLVGGSAQAIAFRGYFQSAPQARFVVRTASEGADTVDVTGSGDAASVKFGEDTKDQRSTSGAADILIVTNGGDDKISIDATITTDAWVKAGKGNDIIAAGGGNDHLDGGAGEDTYVFKADASGNDTVVELADTDIDTLDFEQFGKSVELDLGSTAKQEFGGGSLTLTTAIGIEKVIGSAKADVIRGNSRTNIIFGRDGNDVLTGEGGTDTIEGEGGDDVIFGDGYDLDFTKWKSLSVGLKDFSASGSLGFSLTLTPISGANDFLYGGAGDDVILGGGGDDTIFGNEGSTLIFGDAVGVSAAVTIDVKAVWGGTHSLLTDFLLDIQLVGDGNDTITGGDGTNLIIGGDGNDIITGGDSQGEFDLIFGNGGSDVINGKAGKNIIFGGDGNDTITGGDDGNLIFGDSLGFESKVPFDLKTFFTARPPLPSDLLGKLDLDGSGLDIITGGDGSDVIIGGAERDVIIGKGGTFDLLFGNAGDDEIYGDSKPGEGGASGWNLIVGGEDYDTLYGGGAGSSNAIFGDEVSLNVTIDWQRLFEATPVLSISAGLTLSGNGNDHIFGGPDFDFIVGGKGSDEIDGGNGTNIVFCDDFSIGDTAEAAFDFGKVLLFSGNPAFAVATFVKDVAVGLVTDVLDTIYGKFSGSEGTDPLENFDIYEGGSGNDIVFGGDGPDWLTGNDGFDFLVGGNGNDIVRSGGVDIPDLFNPLEEGTEFGLGGLGDDTIYGSEGNDFLMSTVGDDKFYGLGGDDVIIAGPGNDTLDGGPGSDLLFGEEGDDYLDGGPGNNVLDGGPGNNTLVNNVPSESPVLTAPLPPQSPIPTVTRIGVLAVGSGFGSDPRVRVLNADGSVLREFLAYDVSFRGGVNVAVGDVTGDGVADIVTGAGAGGGPHVKVFDGVTGLEVANFFAYDASFRGGVNVAVGDVTGDGIADIVTGAGAGGSPHVKVFDGKTGLVVASFFAFDLAFHGGVSVAVGDVNADGVPDVIVGAGPGGGPHVKVIDGTRMSDMQPSGVISDSSCLANFFAFDSSFTGGIHTAASVGHFAIGAASGGSPHVKVFDRGGDVTNSFFAFDRKFTGGVRVAFTDMDENGEIDLTAAAGPGGGPHVYSVRLAPFAVITSRFAGDALDLNGVFVA